MCKYVQLMSTYVPHGSNTKYHQQPHFDHQNGAVILTNEDGDQLTKNLDVSCNVPTHKEKNPKF